LKRFKFELEQLLRLKLWKEEEAKKALAEEVAALERLKASLAELQGELADLYGSEGSRSGDG
jgi:flagellar biosynthesis chaperone FliJ